jgi:hypothetical protein
MQQYNVIIYGRLKKKVFNHNDYYLVYKKKKTKCIAQKSVKRHKRKVYYFIDHLGKNIHIPDLCT